MLTGAPEHNRASGDVKGQRTRVSGDRYRARTTLQSLPFIDGADRAHGDRSKAWHSTSSSADTILDVNSRNSLKIACAVAVVYSMISAHSGGGRVWKYAGSNKAEVRNDRDRGHGIGC